LFSGSSAGASGAFLASASVSWGFSPAAFLASASVSCSASASISGPSAGGFLASVSISDPTSESSSLSVSFFL